jgi:outer membrane autotransporter protein
VIQDTNVVLLQDKLTKLGDGELIVVSGRTIFGNVLVKEGLFGGTGTVQGDLTNSSIVAPGNSPGTLYVTKNYKQTEDGTLRIEIASASKYDRLNVGGDASLEGDLKVALVNGYQPGKGKKFTILTAGGEVTGQFDEVSAPVWDNLTLRAFYEDDHVFLKTVIHSFEAVAQTPNQAAVAHVLDEVVYDPRADKLLRQLYKSDFDQLPGDLDELAPDELTSIFSISTSLANVQSLNLQRRTDDIRRGSSGFSASGLAMQGTGPGYSGGLFGAAGPSGYEGKDVKEVKDVVPVDEKKWGAFLTGVGEWVDVDGDGNARGFDITTGGFTLGLDYKVCSNFAIGIAAGYAGTAADLTNDGRVWVNGGKLGVYATAFAGGWYGDFAVNGGYNSYDTKRSVLGGTARGDTEGGELNVLVGTGYDWKIGALQIGPTATFQYTLVGMDDFTENGSLAPLAIGGRNEESLRTSLGFKASADLHAGSVVVRPELRASWQHEFSETSYGLDASFASGAGGNFLVNGPEIGRDSLMVGVGVAVLFNDTVSTYLYYDGELFRDNYEKHSVSGGIRVAF